MIHFAEVRIGGERRFSFCEDGDGDILAAGFVRLDEAEHWATWAQFELDHGTARAVFGDKDAIGDLASYHWLCQAWVVGGKSGDPEEG